MDRNSSSSSCERPRPHRWCWPARRDFGFGSARVRRLPPPETWCTSRLCLNHPPWAFLATRLQNSNGGLFGGLDLLHSQSYCATRPAPGIDGHASGGKLRAVPIGISLCRTPLAGREGVPRHRGITQPHMPGGIVRFGGGSRPDRGLGIFRDAPASGPDGLTVPTAAGPFGDSRTCWVRKPGCLCS
jgi:hypothetical protein